MLIQSKFYNITTKNSMIVLLKNTKHWPVTELFLSLVFVQKGVKKIFLSLSSAKK